MVTRLFLMAVIAGYVGASAIEVHADSFWESPGTGFNWFTDTNWSATNAAQAAPGPIPTIADLAVFNVTTGGGAGTTVNLGNGQTQSALGLNFVTTQAVGFRGGDALNLLADSTLNLGASGITKANVAGSISFGTATAGANLTINLAANQTWTNNSTSTGLTFRLDGPVTVSSSDTRTLILSGSSNGSSITGLDGVLNDGVSSGTLGIQKTGTGTWTLTSTTAISAATAPTGLGQHTFSGGTTISEGTVSVSGPATVANSAASSILSGPNIVSGPLGRGTLTMNGGTLVGNLGNSATNTLHNPIALNDVAGNTFSTTLASGTGTTILAGAMTGTGGFTKAGTGGLTLTGTNSYAGRTTVAAGTLNVTSVANNLGTPSAGNEAIAIGAGATSATLSYTGAGETTSRSIELAGTTGGAVINSSGAGGIAFTGATSVSGDGAKILTLTGNNTGNNEIGGIGDSATPGNTTSIEKTGTGTWSLTGANTFTGAVNFIRGGQLNVTGTHDAGGGAYVVGYEASEDAVMVINNDLTFNHAAAGDYAMEIGTLGTGVVTQTGGTVTTGGASGLIAIGDVSGTGTYNLRGGVLDVAAGGVGAIFAGPGTANFNFTGGTLKVKFFNPNNLSGSFVQGGLTQNEDDNLSLLDVTGNDTAITGSYNLLAGEVAIGALQALTVSGSVELGSEAVWHVQFDGTENSLGQLNVAGALNIEDGAVLDFSGVGTLTESTYVFASYDSLSGEGLLEVLNTPDNYFINYAFNGNQIALQAVPEPGSIALFGIGVLGLRVFGKRRQK